MTANAQAKMMPGSTSGATYFAFAKKGNVVLGIKPYGVHDGEKFNVPGVTFFSARLRSAPAGNLYADEGEKKIVKLQKAPENLWDAWPGVTWEKQDTTRASTTVGVFLRGSFSKGADAMQKLLDAVDNGKLTSQMADYLVGVAGVDNMTVSKRDLQQWLEGQYAPIIAGIVQSIAKAKQVADEFEASVGVFGMQAAILKKVYGGTKEPEPEI